MSESLERNNKYHVTTKTLLYLGGLGGLLGFIVASAVWDLVFGKFDAATFMSDTLILVAICIGTLVLTELFSEESNKNKVLGVYNMAVNSYMEAMQKIEPIRIYFSQWYYWFLDKETKRKRENYLMMSGIMGTDARRIVQFATIADIPNMERCSKRFVKELDNNRRVTLPKLESEEQSVAVSEVLTGQHDITDSGYAKYLFIDDIAEANMSMVERNDYLEWRRAQSKKRANILAIIRLIGTSLLMAALVPADPEEANANKWWTFVKRVGVFCTSFITGWFAGSNDVVASAAIIKDKMNMLSTFYEYHKSGEWKPKSEEELEREFFEEYDKEQEEARASVVEPEVVVPNTGKLLLGGASNE